MQAIFEKIRTYNVWDGKYYNTGYERSEYLNTITRYIGNKLIKVLVGQRRVGKSYVLRQIICYLTSVKGVNPQNIFYLNKEYTAFDEIKSSSDLDALFTYYRQQFSLTGTLSREFGNLMLIRDNYPKF